MGILKRKIAASTLMETLVASSIIIIVFVIASLVLNNIFRNMMRQDSFRLQNKLEELHYLYKNEQIALPYYEDYENYEITIDREHRNPVNYLLIEVKKRDSEKTITQEWIDEVHY